MVGCPQFARCKAYFVAGASYGQLQTIISPMTLGPERTQAQDEPMEGPLDCNLTVLTTLAEYLGAFFRIGIHRLHGFYEASFQTRERA